MISLNQTTVSNFPRFWGKKKKRDVQDFYGIRCAFDLNIYVFFPASLEYQMSWIGHSEDISILVV